MNIFLIENYNPDNEGVGGSYTYTKYLLEYLPKFGCNVSLVGIGKNQKKLFPGFFSVSEKDFISDYIYLIKLLFWVLFRKFPNDTIIHAQRFEYIFPFLLFKKNVKCMITAHGNQLKNIRFKRNLLVIKVYEMVERMVVAKCDRIISVDDQTLWYYEQEYGKFEHDIIPIGVDWRLFHPVNKKEAKKQYNLDLKTRYIIYIGRLEKEKDVNFLIKSFHVANRQEDDLRLLLVGDGSGMKQLTQLVEDLGLKNKIIFLGNIAYTSVPIVINCADLLVLASVYEGSPTVVREALSCGVPVLTTDVGDVRKFINDGRLGSIREKNESSFGEAMVDMLDNKELINDILYRHTLAKKLFSVENMCLQTIEVYNKVLS